MGTTTNEMTGRDPYVYRRAHTATDDGTAVRTEEIRDEIEHTRAEMSQTIDELQEKLSPQHIKEQVKDSVREATIGRAEHMASNAGETATQAGHTVMERIKDNPVAAAMVGIGLGWLFMSNGTKSSVKHQATSVKYQAGNKVGDIADSVHDKASNIAGSVQNKASNFAETAQEQAHRAVDQSQEVLEESPLVAGAVALAVGAAIGFALPETRRENQMMGEARDTMLGHVGEVAQDAAQKVEHVASHAAHAATDAAKQEAHNQGLANSSAP